MHHDILNKDCKSDLIQLFENTFSTSEGEDEGILIGDLVSRLASKIDDQEIICLGTYDNKKIIAAIFFTRLSFDDFSDVYMLAPVAVSTDYQRKGIGQALINFGLDELKERSVALVTTYGDPAFYSKVGFKTVSENIIRAPLKLSMPDGWLAMSLTGQTINARSIRPNCVEEFNNPDYW
jgi:predicted N-acetyltransferase YhbS